MTSASHSPGALLAKLGAFLQVAQVVGFATMWWTLHHDIQEARIAPQELEATMQQVQSMNQLMEASSIYMFAGVGVAILGILMVILAATVYRYRAQWFFWFLCIYGAAMLLSYMLPFGLFFVIYALLKKKEFPLDPPPAPGTLV